MEAANFCFGASELFADLDLQSFFYEIIMTINWGVSPALDIELARLYTNRERYQSQLKYTDFSTLIRLYFFQRNTYCKVNQFCLPIKIL